MNGTLECSVTEDPPESRRYIFIPESIPRIKTGWLTASVSPGPRSLPARWERVRRYLRRSRCRCSLLTGLLPQDEQIYSREREAYEAAWKKLSTAQTLQAQALR